MSFSKLLAAGILFERLAASGAQASTPFDITLCVAGPKAEALEGTWIAPPLKRMR